MIEATGFHDTRGWRICDWKCKKWQCYERQDNTKTYLGEEETSGEQVFQTSWSHLKIPLQPKSPGWAPTLSQVALYLTIIFDVWSLSNLRWNNWSENGAKVEVRTMIWLSVSFSNTLLSPSSTRTPSCSTSTLSPGLVAISPLCLAVFLVHLFIIFLIFLFNFNSDILV